MNEATGMIAASALAAEVVDGLCALLGIALLAPERSALDCAVRLHLRTGLQPADAERLAGAQLARVTVRRLSPAGEPDDDLGGDTAATATLSSAAPAGAVVLRASGAFPTSAAQLRIDYEFH